MVLEREWGVGIAFDQVCHHPHFRLVPRSSIIQSNLLCY